MISYSIYSKYKRNIIFSHQNRINPNPLIFHKRYKNIQKNSYHTIMQQDEAPVVETLSKDLVFKQYSSLELSTRDRFIKRIREEGYDSKDILWVATEKIHGSNFSIHFNGQSVRYGRRTDFLSKDIPVPCENPKTYFNQSFYDAGNLVTKFHDKLRDVFENLKAFDPKAIKFAIYGEYFGGSWPEDHPAYQKGPKAVQKGIHYTPKHQFYAFDIFVTTLETAYWVDVLDIPKILKESIPSVPVYAKGSFEEVFNINTEIDSTIPQLFGYPKLEKNITEGMVIRPNRNLSIKSGQRVIIKKKNQQFMEKASAPNPAKKQKKQKQINPQIAASLDQLSKYLNLNRINSVVSKFPDLKDRNKLKDLINKDILDDAAKDGFKPLQNEQKSKQVIKQLNNLIIKEVNAYFVKH